MDFQNIVGSDFPEENIIIVYLKGNPIEHRDADGHRRRSMRSGTRAVRSWPTAY
jgi:hypothetical protein